jgi:hypothetical protein
LLRSFALAAVALALSAAPVRAQVLPKQPINISVNYVYAAELGFGGYRVGGLTVDVYSVPIEFTLRDVLLDWRLKIGLPIQYGTYDFKKTVEGDDGLPVRVTASQRTLGFNPKLKLEIPVTEPWTLSLIGAWGVASTFDTDVHGQGSDGVRYEDRSAEEDFWFYTYEVGVSSLLQQREGLWTLSLGNAFVYAGTAGFSRNENVEAYGAIETGVDARHPLGFRVMDYAPDVSGFFIWYWFTPSLEFSRVERNALEVDNVYEVGMTFGADPETPFQLPVLGNPRLGVSYRFGDNIDAVRLNFGFPF